MAFAISRPRKMVRAARQRLAEEPDDHELDAPTLWTVPRLIWLTIRTFFVERPGQIIGSAFLLLMLWGTHGNLELLRHVWPGWVGVGGDPATNPSVLPGVLWGNELVSFVAGAFLLVVVPILLIRFVFRQPLAAYGLGLPPVGRRRLAYLTFLTLMAISLPGFWIGSQDPAMRALYPLYRFNSFPALGDFVLYQLSYLPFFIAIEFIFRGYLLFGLAGTKDDDVGDAGGGLPGPLFFARYGILIQMLSYTAWHLGKPLPELWGTAFWGLAAGASAYAVRSIWPVVLAHWILNIILDALILST